MSSLQSQGRFSSVSSSGEHGELIYTIIAALLGGYLLLGVRIVRPTHRVLVEILGKFQKFGGPGILLGPPWIPEALRGEYH